MGRIHGYQVPNVSDLHIGARARSMPSEGSVEGPERRATVDGFSLGVDEFSAGHDAFG